MRYQRVLRRWLTCCGLLLAAWGCSDGTPAKDVHDAWLDAPVAEDKGFGDYCTHIAHECKTDYVCVRGSVAAVGFCSKSCTNKGAACTGVPTGSYAECAGSVGTSGSLVCIFLCGKGYRCPSALKCDQSQPVGGGLYRCIPS